MTRRMLSAEIGPAGAPTHDLEELSDAIRGDHRANGRPRLGARDVRSGVDGAEEIFDVAATAAARCFFSKLLDALGAQADSSFNELDPTLRAVLTVGRPVSAAPATAER